MNRRIKLVIIFVDLLCVLGVLLFFYEPLMNYITHNKSLSSQQFDYIYMYDNGVVIDNSFFVLNSVLNPSNHEFKAELLMQKQAEYTESSPFQYTKELEADEVAVSQNLLSKVGLSVGDIICFRNPIVDAATEYIIVDALPSTYGFYEENVDFQYGVLIFGYDDYLVQMMSLKSVCFVDAEFSASKEEISLVSLTNLDDQISSVNRTIVLIYVEILAFLGLIQLAVWIVCIVFSEQRAFRLYRLGAGNDILNKYVIKNFSSILILQIGLLILFLSPQLMNSNLFILLTIFGVVLMLFFEGVLLHCMFMARVRRSINYGK